MDPTTEHEALSGAGGKATLELSKYEALALINSAMLGVAVLAGSKPEILDMTVRQALGAHRALGADGKAWGELLDRILIEFALAFPDVPAVRRDANER